MFETSENCCRLLRIIGHFWELYETSENCLVVLRTVGYFQELFETSEKYPALPGTVWEFWKLLEISKHTATLILLFLVSCGIIAMNCSTSYTNDLCDIIAASFSYDWAYEIGWISVAIALFGSIISSIDLIMSERDAGNPTIISFTSDSFWWWYIKFNFCVSFVMLLLKTLCKLVFKVWFEKYITTKANIKISAEIVLGEKI